MYASRLRAKEILDHTESSTERVGSLKVYGDMLQAIGPATEKARRPNIKRRRRGTNSCWQLADRRCWRQAMSAIGMSALALWSFGLQTPVNSCALAEEHSASAARRVDDGTDHGRSGVFRWRFDQQRHSVLTEACRWWTWAPQRERRCSSPHVLRHQGVN